MYIYIYIYTNRWSEQARAETCVEEAHAMWVRVDIQILQEGIINRTEPAEPNGTEPFNSGTGRNRTRKRTEPDRTEPRRVRKTQAEPRRTGEQVFPNRTEPNPSIFEQSGTETNRTEPVPFRFLRRARRPPAAPQRDYVRVTPPEH